MNHNTKSYTQETPAWLWDVWTSGPGQQADRYAERINGLLALDTLSDCPDDLDDLERRQAEAMVEEVLRDGV